MKSFPIPRILQCNRFVAKSVKEDSRFVRDYEFDLYLDGERDIYIDDRHYKTSKGCLVFRRPGQLVRATGDYNMYMLTLDFSRSDERTGAYVRGSGTPQQKSSEIDVIEGLPDVFYPAHSEELISLYKAMSRCSYPNVVNREQQERLVPEFLFQVLADSYNYTREIGEKKPKTYVERACNYINKNYSGALSVGQIAEHLSLNKNYLIKLFKKEISMTPNKYIVETRLYYARLMLLQTELSVSEIAAACGFLTPSYFIKCFREKYSVSPLAYKKQTPERELIGKSEE